MSWSYLLHPIHGCLSLASYLLLLYLNTFSLSPVASDWPGRCIPTQMAAETWCLKRSGIQNNRHWLHHKAYLRLLICQGVAWIISAPPMPHGPLTMKITAFDCVIDSALMQVSLQEERWSTYFPACYRQHKHATRWHQTDGPQSLWFLYNWWAELNSPHDVCACYTNEGAELDDLDSSQN